MNDTEGRCGAAKRSGGTCQKPAGWGTVHVGIGACRIHAGSTPSAIVKAQRQAAAAAVETYGLPRNIGPHEALLEEIHRTAGAVQWLELRIRDLDPNALVWGKVEERVTMSRIGEGGEDGAGFVKDVDVVHRAAINIWLGLYQAERRHMVDVCRTAIACGIAEREVRLAEKQGELIARVLTGVLGELGVDVEEQRVRVALRAHLALVAAS